MVDELNDQAPVGGDIGPIAEMSRSKATVVERIQMMSGELERLTRERDELSARLEQEAHRSEDLTSKLRVAEVELNASRKEAELLRGERDSLSAKLEKETERAEEAGAKVRMIEVELNAAREEVDLQQGEKTKVQGERGKLQDELRRLRTELEVTVRAKQKLEMELSTARNALADIERAFGK